jgi:allantoinase
VHIVHLSAGEALDDLRTARTRGLPVTVETCPHYLVLDAEGIVDGATQFKCAPPIRSHANRERLWQGLADRDIDLVVSDHSPCPPELKAGDFATAWGGIESLEVGMAVTWAEARRRSFEPADLVRWMSTAPAALAGFAGRKGVIAAGADADLVVWNPDEVWTVDHRRLRRPWLDKSRARRSPYEGRPARGRVELLVAGGEWVLGGPVTGAHVPRLPRIGSSPATTPPVDPPDTSR